MKQLIKKAVPLFLLFAVVVAFSSCNRGYGCPSKNFSLDYSVIDNHGSDDVLE